MHCSETHKTTSTAHLLSLLVPKSEIHVIGQLEKRHDLTQMIEPGTIPLVLFPEPSAPLLDQRFVESLPMPVTLIVPDGTWRQARKLTHKLSEFRGIRRVQLAAGAPSRYLLRRNQSKGGVCTLEAIARALGVLDGNEVQEALEQHLAVMVQRVLFSRQTSKPYDGTFDLPPAEDLVR